MYLNTGTVLQSESLEIKHVFIYKTLLTFVVEIAFVYFWVIDANTDAALGLSGPKILSAYFIFKFFI